MTHVGFAKWQAKISVSHNIKSYSTLDDTSIIEVSYGAMMDTMHRQLLHGTTTLLVLAVLADGERHGYGIRQKLIQNTHSEAVPSEGNLYPLLAGLEKRGLVRSHIEKGRGKQERLVYGITVRGRKELQAQANRWQTFSYHVNKFLRRQLGSTV